MKLAAYQGSGTSGDPGANLELMAEQAQVAANLGAELLIFPELFLSGYNIGDAAWKLAEPLDGSSLKHACEIARNHHIALLFGYPEREGAQVYNSSVLIDSTGMQVSNYRKMHLFGSEERRLFMPGDQFVLHTMNGWQLGLLICFDIEFPESARALALQGAQLLVIPTAITDTRIAEITIPARALENQLFIAYINRTGTEDDLTYSGKSCIVGPDGTVLASADEFPKLLFVDLDQSAIHRERSRFSYLQERRFDCY
ncbi:MAG: carbon-nitrogen hydrolase family protein [Anaerolineae bacterium]|nr:carbon-nitrogen hydrolase family protein [Gloeobacterales cyanobacterium ES-bin-313]